MFVAAIRAVFDQQGELSAAVELRRLFPGITSTMQAREWARTIAAWKPLPVCPVRRIHPGRGRHTGQRVPISRSAYRAPLAKNGSAQRSRQHLAGRSIPTMKHRRGGFRALHGNVPSVGLGCRPEQ
jgi:hypothetical protein